MPSVIAVGECMVELSLLGGGQAALGYAGDVFNTAPHGAGEALAFRGRSGGLAHNQRRQAVVLVAALALVEAHEAFGGQAADLAGGRAHGGQAGPEPPGDLEVGLAQRKPHWIDFDAGRIVAGQSLDDAADSLMRLVLQTASGAPTRAEDKGEREIALWKRGATN